MCLGSYNILRVQWVSLHILHLLLIVRLGENRKPFFIRFAGEEKDHL